jgi:hypothetical protein
MEGKAVRYQSEASLFALTCQMFKKIAVQEPYSTHFCLFEVPDFQAILDISCNNAM